MNDIHFYLSKLDFSLNTIEIYGTTTKRRAEKRCAEKR